MRIEGTAMHSTRGKCRVLRQASFHFHSSSDDCLSLSKKTLLGFSFRPNVRKARSPNPNSAKQKIPDLRKEQEGNHQTEKCRGWQIE
jgi:hypothetical protein